MTALSHSASPSTTPSAPRAPRRSRRRASSVWLLPQQASGESSSLNLTWLEAVARRVATIYTRRGAHVLLLVPPTPQDRREAIGRPVQEALATWTATAQLLARLGRPTHVRTLTTLPQSLGDTTPNTSAESGPRPLMPTPLEATRQPRPARTDRHTDRSGQSVAHTAPDRYPLLITYLDPHQTDWSFAVPWARLMTRHGTLAMITQGDKRCDHSGRNGCLLEHMTREGGLALVDRIAMVAAPDQNASHAVAGQEVHTELLVLARPASTAPSCPTQEVGQ